MKNVSDKWLIFALMLFFVALFACRVHAQQFVYKGVYSVESIMTNYCDDCFLELPPDFLRSELVLSVSTDNEQQLFKSLQTSSRAIGWELTRQKDGTMRAEPLLNLGNMVYISCMDKLPKNVPKYLYTASVKSDKLQCAERDSLANLARIKAQRDSVIIDSLQRAKLDFQSYQLRYYSFSHSFAKNLGVEWGSFLASGNLRGKLEVFDDWRIIAQNTNDTTFTSRHALQQSVARIFATRNRML